MAFVVDEGGRKRRRTTLLTTEPCPSQAISNEDDYTTSPPTIGNIQDPTNDVGEWDYLLRWARNDTDHVLAHDLEDEDDNTINFTDGLIDDLTDDLEDEIVYDEEPAPVIEPASASRAQTGRMSRDEVISIINERIEYYSNQWKPGKGEGNEVPDAEVLWDDAEADGRRQKLLDLNKDNAAFFRHRLDKLGDEILLCSWRTADEVRRVCKNLETTVDLLEEAEWLASIYELAPENPHPHEDAVTEVQNELSQRFIEVVDLGSDSDSPQSRKNDNRTLVDGSSNAHRKGASNSTLALAENGIKSLEPKMEYRFGSLNSIRTQHLDVVPTTAPGTWHVQQQVHRDNPGLSSISTVAGWDWDELIAKQDRKRIIMKAIREMNASDRETIRTRINSVKKQNLMMEIPACVKMFVKGEKRVPGVLPQDLPKVVTFTKLFLSWWLADDCFRKEPEEWRVRNASEDVDADCPDLDIFYHWVRHIVDNTLNAQSPKRPHAPSQAEIIEISDDD